MKKKYLLLIFACVLISCKNKKELELQEREKALDVRQKKLTEQEDEYKSLLLLRDSINNVKDSIEKNPVTKEWPEKLRGVWNSKMLCTESNCSNYVIGDQRNENWQFVSDSTGIYVNVFNNKKLKRVFNAKYIDDKISLEYNNDTILKSKVKIDVILDNIKDKLIKGTQIVTTQDDCVARFSVELTLPQKK